MKIKNKMLIITLILLSLFMIGTVSAASDTEDIVNSDVNNEKVTTATTNDVSDSSVEKTSKSTDIGTSDSLKKTETIKEEKTSTNKNDTQKKTEKDTLESENSNLLSKTSTNTLKSTTDTSKDILKDSAIIEVDSWSKLKNNITNNNEISIKLIKNLTTNGDHITINNGKVVTINGNGHTIDAQGKGTYGIFQVYGATLILENLKLINGTTNIGGAITAADGSQINITNSTLQNNNANKYGGAIGAWSNSKVNITQSTLQNNNAEECGGAIYIGYNSQLNITTSTLTNNTAKSGGAIYTDVGSVLNVDYCLFQENTAYSGLAIYAKGSTTTVDGAYNAFTDKNCIDGDASISLDGVICRSDSFTSLYYQIMNSPTTTIILNQNYTYYPNSEEDKYDNDSAYIKGIPITTTVHIKGNGHTISGSNLARIFRVTDGGNLILENITLTKGQGQEETIEGNIDTWNVGGAIYIDNAKVTLINTTLQNNNAEDGGAIYAQGNSQVNITQSTLQNNNAEYGGAISTYNSQINITTTTLQNNNAEYDGGAILASNSQVNITQSTLQNNQATGDLSFGGAISAGYNSQINITTTTLQNNQATGTYADGGAIYAGYKSKIGIISSLFMDNNANKGSTIYGDNFDNLTVNHNIFLNNSETNSVIYLIKTGSSNIEYNLDSNWFGNTADNSTNKPNIGFENIDGSKFDNWLFLNANADPDTIIGLGGYSDIVFKLFLYNESATDKDKVSPYDNTQLKPVNLTISKTNGDVEPKTTILGKPITYTPNTIGKGSITASIANIEYTKEIKIVREDSFTALYNNITKSIETGTPLTLDHNYTYDSSTDENFIEGIPITTNVHIIGNGHTISGSNTARIFQVNGELILENLKLIKGKTDSGGAIYAKNAKVTLINTTLTNNKATGYGGVIDTINSQINITQSILENNNAKNGGAIFATYNSQVNINNSTIQNNKADGVGGGAIRVNNAQVNIKNSIIKNNQATGEDSDGGAIHAEINAYITITNSTLQNNNAKNGGAIWVETGSKLSVIGSLFMDNNANVNGSAIYGWIFDDLTVNHNIFLNNTGNVIYLNKNEDYVDFEYNLDYNWFGNNATDYNVTTPNIDSNIDIEFNNWLFLNATADPNPNIGKKPSEITFKLYIYDVVSGITPYTDNQLKTVNLTITKTKGETNKNNATIGETIRYTPNEYGIGSITASIANIEYTQKIKVARDDSFTALYENITKSTEEITTITLKHNYTYDDTTDQDLQKGIIINKTVHIIGNGYTISGNNTARIFKVTNGGNLTLENITLIKGQGQKETTYYGDQNVGGAISVNNGNLTIINSTLQNNTANNGDGGAIYADNSQVNITNSTLTNNTATNGGAIYEDNNSNITITNSTLQNNTATNGGAIFTWYSNITITNSTLQNNTARHWGGAICVLEETKTSIKSSLFMDNNADVNGGAIYGLNFDELTVNHNIFLNTTKNNIIYLKKNGGAFVYNLDSNWFDNTADNYTNKPNIEFKDIDEPKFDNWLFLNATADPDLINVLSSSNITFILSLYNSSSKNVTIYDNSQLKPVNLTITYTNGIVDKKIAKLNETIGYTPENSGIGSVTASIGGVSYTKVIKAIKDTSYTALYNNINQTTDPVIIILTQDYIYDPSTDTEFQDGIIINKTVIIKGDGHNISGNNTAVIFHVTENGNLTLENITLTNGNGLEGGAISVNNGNLTIINSTLTNNTADEGGAIDAINANVTIINSTFTNNTATYDGGAILAGASNLTITNTTMTNNTAGENGGAIAIDAINAIQTNIINSTFTQNNATQYGGAIYTNNDLTVENSLFKDNNASRGSGVYVNNALFTSKNNTFINNNVDGENYKIRPRDPQITIPNIADITEGNPVTITITADEEFNTELVLNVNGNNYTVKMLNGKGQITISDLKPGTYTATIAYPGNENYTNTTVTSNTFKVNTKPAPSPSPAPTGKQNTKIIAKNKVYKPAKYRTYTVTVKNKKGKPVKNTKVKLKVGKKTYIRKTNKKGVATFKIKNTKKSKKSKKTKKYSKITATLNKKNKKDKLTLKRGSKTNKATTNNKGVATFKIKNSKIKTRKYTITLKTTNNQIIKKQKVTLKVKGKTYKAKTNNKGKATFKITNLNKKGKYKTTIKYNGNQNYNKSNKKVKITIKE